MFNKRRELEIGGISFGLTSGVITTLGIIVGLNSATEGSKLAILAAILTIAIADSLSDALGIYLSEESRLDEKKKPVWAITIFTFLGKSIFSFLFALPILLLSTDVAVIFSIILGFLLILILAFIIARRRKQKPLKYMLQDGLFTIAVLFLSYLMGELSSLITN